MRRPFVGITFKALLGSAAVLTGCGSSNTSSSVNSTHGNVSCAQSSTSGTVVICDELDLAPEQRTVTEPKCVTTVGGTWSASACPSESRVAGGHCKIPAVRYSLPDKTVKVYFYTPNNLDFSQATCSGMSGEWVSSDS